MALLVEQILVGGFDENFSYIIHSDATQEAFIVDPSGDFGLVLEKITLLRLDVVGILLTHTHADHMDAVMSATTQFSVPVFVHDAGVIAVDVDSVHPISDGNEIALGNKIITVLHTPGHSADSVCFLFTQAEQQLMLISGDTLFVDGCGRTDDYMVRDLYVSLQLLKRLPPETMILPGHNYGSVTTDTLSSQLLSNRFLLPTTFAAFCRERLGYTMGTQR